VADDAEMPTPLTVGVRPDSLHDAPVR